MGLLKNRLRTIVGEDAGFMQALSSLFVYSTNPQRIARLGKKLSAKLFNKKLTYEQLLAKQIIGDPQLPATVEFYIVSRYAHSFKYPNNKIIEETEVNSVPATAYLLFLDDTDTLHEGTLQELNNTIVEHNFPDLVSFDFDYMKEGKRIDPQFNPAWSPQRLTHHNYLQNAVCLKKSLLRENEVIGNAAHTCYAIALQHAQERIATAHIPKVMLSKQYGEQTEMRGSSNIGHSSKPLVSIIIPTFNKSHLVKQCISSIIKGSQYSNYEIILVDNRSTEEALLVLIDEWKKELKEKFVHLKANYEFNFSKLMNDGAQTAKGEYLLLLNNDTEVISPDWIEQLLAMASQPTAGCVGAKLWYPNDTIQHAGVALNEEVICKHIYLGRTRQDSGYRNALNTVQNYMAITAACLMVSKSKYHEVSGFNETFEVEFNDIDFCLRLYEHDYYNAYTPYAELYHYESASRQHPLARRKSYKRHLTEASTMRALWEDYIYHDPFVSKNAVALGLIS